MRAVIFDMDGVLVDSEPLINRAAVQMFHERGDTQVRPEDFTPFVGGGEDRYIAGVAAAHDITLDVAVAKARTYAIYLDIVDELHPYPGAVDLVYACRLLAPVAVASATDRIRLVANLAAATLPVDSWDVVVDGEDVAHKKPAPDAFLLAAARLEMDPSLCTVVEDSVNGVHAAKSAGMRCVAVAQTFPAAGLGEADLVRPTIGAITLTDLGL
jgi:HAD superfamily hydrolase (TIGR01509 family)